MGLWELSFLTGSAFDFNLAPGVSAAAENPCADEHNPQREHRRQPTHAAVRHPVNGDVISVLGWATWAFYDELLRWLFMATTAFDLKNYSIHFWRTFCSPTNWECGSASFV